jgi:hypothetical protein
LFKHANVKGYNRHIELLWGLSMKPGELLSMGDKTCGFFLLENSTEYGFVPSCFMGLLVSCNTMEKDTLVNTMRARPDTAMLFTLGHGSQPANL